MCSKKKYEHFKKFLQLAILASTARLEVQFQKHVAFNILSMIALKKILIFVGCYSKKLLFYNFNLSKIYNKATFHCSKKSSWAFWTPKKSDFN